MTRLLLALSRILGRPDRKGVRRSPLAWLVCLALFPVPAVAGPFIYTSNRSTNDVTVIDRATRSVVAQVAVGVEPRGIAVHPDGSAAYVATDEGLYIIDAVTFQTTQVPLECDSGSGVVVAPNGRSVLVGHRNCSIVSQVSLASLRVTTLGASVANSYRIASGPLGDYVYAISRVGALARAPWSTLTFAPVFLGGTQLTSVANEPDGMVVDSYGSVWISQNHDPGNAVQVLAISPSNGTPLLLATTSSGVRVDGMGIASTLGGVGQIILAANTADRRVERMFTSPQGVSPGEPLSVAGGPEGEMATGNDNDVTGQGGPNDGSVTVFDGSVWSVVAGRNPDHLVFGPASGADLNCSPNPLEFIYSKWGVPKVGTITVRSTGTGPLKIGDLSITGPDAGDFAMVRDTCSRTMIAVGGDCEVDVEFRPTKGGGRSSSMLGSTIQFLFRGYAAELEIPSNAAGSFVRTNALVGTHISQSFWALEIVNKYGQLRLTRTNEGG